MSAHKGFNTLAARVLDLVDEGYRDAEIGQRLRLTNSYVQSVRLAHRIPANRRVRTQVPMSGPEALDEFEHLTSCGMSPGEALKQLSGINPESLERLAQRRGRSDLASRIHRGMERKSA